MASSRHIISKKAFAALFDVTPSRVSQWIKEGKLKPPAIVGRGRSAQIDVNHAVKQLQGSLDPAQMMANGKAKLPAPKSEPASVETVQDARDAIALVGRVLEQEGIVPDGAIDYPMARLAETILKVRERDLRIAERKATLVPLAAVKDHIAKAFTGYRQAVQRMPSRYVPEMAAKLQVDPGQLEAELQRMIHETLTGLSEPVVRVG